MDSNYFCTLARAALGRGYTVPQVPKVRLGYGSVYHQPTSGCQYLRDSYRFGEFYRGGVGKFTLFNPYILYSPMHFEIAFYTHKLTQDAYIMLVHHEKDSAKFVPRLPVGSLPLNPIWDVHSQTTFGVPNHSYPPLPLTI